MGRLSVPIVRRSGRARFSRAASSYRESRSSSPASGSVWATHVAFCFPRRVCIGRCCFVAIQVFLQNRRGAVATADELIWHLLTRRLRRAWHGQPRRWRLPSGEVLDDVAVKVDDLLTCLGDE